jgi:hypothetical protein
MTEVEINPLNPNDLIPSKRLTSRYIERLETLAQKLKTKIAKVEQDRRLDEHLLETTTSEEVRTIYSKRIDQYTSELSHLNRRQAQLVELQLHVRQSPNSFFLPIGATVVCKGNYDLLDVDGIDSSIRPLRPVKGSKGIVVGFNEQDVWAVKVVFFDEVVDGDGEMTWDSDRDGEALTIPFHAKDLEVISLPTFVDGSSCHSFDFIRTHVSDDGDDDDNTSGTMILICEGVPVEISAYDIEDEIPWYQDAQAWTDLEPLSDFKPYISNTRAKASPAL